MGNKGKEKLKKKGGWVVDLASGTRCKRERDAKDLGSRGIGKRDSQR